MPTCFDAELVSIPTFFYANRSMPSDKTPNESDKVCALSSNTDYVGSSSPSPCVEQLRAANCLSLSDNAWRIVGETVRSALAACPPSPTRFWFNSLVQFAASSSEVLLVSRIQLRFSLFFAVAHFPTITYPALPLSTHTLLGLRYLASILTWCVPTGFRPDSTPGQSNGPGIVCGECWPPPIFEFLKGIAVCRRIGDASAVAGTNFGGSPTGSIRVWSEVLTQRAILELKRRLD
ncbi:hypothetical protein L1887_52909 [Cichorium endivia]|nr:hypothetical protein L1887_52909 [Cichorium endivia]